jgi:hypothetical protein
MELIHAESGEIIMDASVEVRKVEMKKTAKAVICAVAFRVRGLETSAASSFAAHLDQRITVGWTINNDQQSLSFSPALPTSAVKVITAKKDDLWVFGIQTGRDEDMLILDDFGVHRTAHTVDVTSEVILAPSEDLLVISGKTSLAEIAKTYFDQVTSSQVVASWKYAILSLAETISDESTSGVLEITETALKRAVEIVVEGDQ